MDIVRLSPEETELSAPELARAGTETSLSRIVSLPALLRALGATILIAAAAAFMLQEWSSMSHLMRYFSFLAFTILLSVSGFVCGLKLKEDKSARTFLALAAAVVPVHFCQLGALIYSRFPETAVSYPSWLLWRAPSHAAAFGTTAAGIALLVPVIFVSFSSLVRSEAGRLTAAYLLVNCLLLVPTRLPNYVALIALCMFGLAALVELEIARAVSVMRTKEGRFVRVMIWVPLLLLVLRTINLYSMSFFFFSATSACLAAFLLLIAPKYVTSVAGRSMIEACSLVPAFLSIVGMVGGLAELRLIGEASIVPALFLPFAAVVALSSRAVSRYGRGYRATAGVVAMLATLGQLSLFPGLLSATYCICVGLGCAWAAFHSESRTLLFGGVAVFGVGILYYLSYAVDAYAFSAWLCLAVLGIAVVFASSFLEKNSGYVAQEASRIKERISAWR